MSEREGPELIKFVVTEYSCEGCVWLRRTDKKWMTATDCFHPKWDGPLPGLCGRSLGGDTDTPDWCPYLQAPDIKGLSDD